MWAKKYPNSAVQRKIQKKKLPGKELKLHIKLKAIIQNFNLIRNNVIIIELKEQHQIETKEVQQLLRSQQEASDRFWSSLGKKFEKERE